MIYDDTLRCCNNHPTVIVEYDVGSLGKRKFLVCSIHIRKEPWNKHILSQKEIK